jgi:glyoxylase-like metal-dependent hydrolase (beta-lactamase superfamily II)
MQLEQIRPRLWRWTALHPDWTPDEGGPDGWAQEVASYALVEDDTLVLFDPLVPADDEEPFWRALDDDVQHHGAPQILLTVYWHARSAQQIVDRYPGARTYSAAAGAEHARERVAEAAGFEPGATPVAGVEARPTDDPEEVVFWIPSQRAVVAGDVLLGTEDGDVRVFPEAWLNQGTTIEQVRASLRPLLDLPVELVLLTHGEAVRDDALAALAAVLE